MLCCEHDAFKRFGKQESVSFILTECLVALFTCLSHNPHHVFTTSYFNPECMRKHVGVPSNISFLLLSS